MALGDTFPKPPKVTAGKVSATYYQQDAAWKEQVKKTLETAPANPATLASPATGGALTLTGALTAASVTTSGAVAATGAVSGASVTTTEADIRHGDRVLMIGASAGQSTNTSTTTCAAFVNSSDTESYYEGLSGGSCSVTIGIPLCVGDRIKSVKMYGRNSSTVTTWTFKVYKHAMGSSTWTQLGSTQTSGSGSAVDASLSVTGLTETVVAGTRYYARWGTTSAAANQPRLYGIEVTYDRIA